MGILLYEGKCQGMCCLALAHSHRKCLKYELTFLRPKMLERKVLNQQVQESYGYFAKNQMQDSLGYFAFDSREIQRLEICRLNSLV